MKNSERWGMGKMYPVQNFPTEKEDIKNDFNRKKSINNGNKK